MKRTTQPNVPIKVGDFVRWNDPAINDYDVEDREETLNRVFEVFAINGEIYCLTDGFSEIEALEHELVKVSAYFVEVSRYNDEINKFELDVDNELGINDLYYDTKEQGANSIHSDISCCVFDITEDDVLLCRVIEGEYNMRECEWKCPPSGKRNSKVVHTTIVGHKDRIIDVCADESLPDEYIYLG